MLNWNFLETFVVLSENLNFSETAKILNTAQPVVSRQIKMLEENLGYALFLRSKKSVALSPEGLELKRKLGPLVEEIKRVLILDRSENSTLLKINIRMGSMYEAGQLLLLPKVAQFLEVHPESTIHVSLMSTSLVNDQVAKGILDFGFVYELSERKSVKAFAVTQDIPVMIADKKAAANWRKQERYNFIGYRENDLYLKGFLERHLNKTEMSKVRYLSSVNSHGAIIDLVRKQHGMSVIPKTSAVRAVEKGYVEIVEQDKKPQTLYLICHEQILIDKRKKVFLDYLLKQFKDAKS
ncbi:LysR family transcriptional regulator [Bdellovibrio sp. BCCA]|uniref:LysR family transcriptional regulator n=1 Tax=Bdellovibrio sp. BCCA TaxID=3136281 RepID=UPI0030F0B90F